MVGLEFIKAKQQSWAKRRGLELVGGTISNRGEKNYSHNLADNLFEQLTKESLASYKSGDGGEIKDTKTRLAKMKALHSSSAIVVNLFQYWQNKDIYPILYASKLSTKHLFRTDFRIEDINFQQTKAHSILKNDFGTKIKFEEKFEISEDKFLFPHSPNIDVVIRDSQSTVYAIESKFTEPYNSRKSEGIKQKYVENISFWDGLPNLYEFAKDISPNNNKFLYLDAAQLIKHILGLKKSYKKNDFHLLYLWYDVIGKDGVEHRKEVEQFAEIVQKDNIKFSHTTYQETIIKLSKKFYDGNEEYCNYLTDRYL